MIEAAILFAAGCYGIALLLDLWRIAQGPDAADRILALDTLNVTAIAELMLLGMHLKSAVYFEAAAVIVTLILLGRWMEARAKGRAEGDAMLASTAPHTMTPTVSEARPSGATSASRGSKS